MIAIRPQRLVFLLLPFALVACGGGDVRVGGDTCGGKLLGQEEQGGDGNAVSGDGWSADCRAGFCGNGIIETPEMCDDGNIVGGDGCSVVCTTETGSCGDGILDATEICDDKNRAAGDGCGPDCQAESCGDGVVQTGEECEIPGTPICHAQCTFTQCR